MSERITEIITRKLLDDLGYYDDPSIVVEEQKSQNPIIQKCLSSASKSGNGVGRPEFIITSSKEPNLLIVIECKPDIAKHQSDNHDQYVEYAVDGALNYARYLSKDFNVIAIGISGQENELLKISNYLLPKGSKNIYIIHKISIVKTAVNHIGFTAIHCFSFTAQRP